MDLSEFQYHLDDSFIAQTPLQNRDESKLMVLNKETGHIKHSKFFSIVDFFKPGDCLVLNNSKVLKARLFGINELTGARLEFLLLNSENNVWNVLCRPAKRAKKGGCFSFDGMMKAKILSELADGCRVVEFDHYGEQFFQILNKIGKVPLPPYIKTDLNDSSRYQTIYCTSLGSIAAPTAGLHFTNELLEKLKQKGVKICFLTLHVGLGTFRPVTVKQIEFHQMHYEQYFLSQESADLINEAKSCGRKVFCVGTTSCRTLESVWLKHGKICADCGLTNLFIYPGFKFNVMNGLITNFHLPQSTLLMLVSAFVGRKKILKAYEQAKLRNYRFFSFGDAMLII